MRSTSTSRFPSSKVARVPVGTSVRIVLPGTQPPRTLPGKIAAVDPNVDPLTRAVKLRASVEEDGDKKSTDQLRPGMFVNVSVVLPDRASVVFVPDTSIMRAQYGNSVYIVEDRKDEVGHPVNGPGGKRPRSRVSSSCASASPVVTSSPSTKG